MHHTVDFFYWTFLSLHIFFFTKHWPVLFLSIQLLNALQIQNTTIIEIVERKCRFLFDFLFLNICGNITVLHQIIIKFMVFFKFSQSENSNKISIFWLAALDFAKKIKAQLKIKPIFSDLWNLKFWKWYSFEKLFLNSLCQWLLDIEFFYKKFWFEM